MYRICAWCKKDLDTDKQYTDEEYIALMDETTGGICPECEAKAIRLQEDR